MGWLEWEKTLNILVVVGKTAQKNKWWDREDKGSGFRKERESMDWLWWERELKWL